MGHKRKGQLTTDAERHQHLRKIGKRFFWKGERIAERKMINEHLSELNIQNHIPFLTFEELSSCIVETDIKDKAYKKISEIIIAAERNWRTPCDSINDFIITLENEINGPVTKSNLNLLLNQYSENTIEKTWESESISTLIKVFEITNETDLKTIFINLVEKVNHGRTK